MSKLLRKYRVPEYRALPSEEKGYEEKRAEKNDCNAFRTGNR